MGWVIIFLCAVMAGLGIALFFTKVIVLCVLLAVAVYLLLGLKPIQEQQRGVVELFGEYFMTLKPGLQWLLRGAMKIKDTIAVYEQEIPLFSDEPAVLDLKDGSIIPLGAKAFVKLKSPDKPYDSGDGKQRTGVYRAIYKTPDWKEFIEDRLENALRSYLNAFTIDEVLTAAKAGFNLADHRPDIGLPNNELKLIEGDLEKWGFELLRITITDFDLPSAIKKARDDVQVRERQAEAAKFERVKRARETMGVLIQMVAEATGVSFTDAQAEVKSNPALKKEMAEFGKELITRRMSGDAKALTDIRVGGGGDLDKGLMGLIAAFSALRKTNKKEKKGKEEEEEEKETEGD